MAAQRFNIVRILFYQTVEIVLDTNSDHNHDHHQTRRKTLTLSHCDQVFVTIDTVENNYWLTNKEITQICYLVYQHRLNNNNNNSSFVSLLKVNIILPCNNNRDINITFDNTNTETNNNNMNTNCGFLVGVVSLPSKKCLKYIFIYTYIHSR